MLTRLTQGATTSALVLLAATACGHATGAVTAPVTMSFCGGSPEASPDVVLVVCYTDDITARDMAWSAWGKPVATGRGTAVIDLCAYNDCHTGSFGSTPIELIASKIMPCGQRGKAYSQLRYVFPKGTPWPGTPANTDTSGYLTGSHRVLPPADQTVSLTC